MDLWVTHTPGRHCASTALADLAGFRGLPWSEALCFGLGCGLGIWYFDLGAVSPFRLMHVRSADIEAQFFGRIGQAFDWRRFDDPAESERALIGELDAGNPVLVQTDIYYLPHFNKSAHFPGHDVAVWGYDPERRVFIITDTEHPGTLEVPFDDMRKARYCSIGFFRINGNMFAPGPLSEPGDLGGIVRRAIIDNSRSIAGPAFPGSGLDALRAWMADLPAWETIADWRWTARFASQVIEKRGTGGGGFRPMYADFLEEAALLLPAVRDAGLPGLMRNAGLAWRELSLALRRMSEADAFSPAETADALDLVLKKESACHGAAAGL